LPSETFTVDIHCVTKWSKLGTTWSGVSLDRLLEGQATEAGFVSASCDGGYTTNLLLSDLTGGKAWVVHTFEGEPLAPEHGDPARLLVPQLYLWKSAKWPRRLTLTVADEPGFWEASGYLRRASSCAARPRSSSRQRTCSSSSATTPTRSTPSASAQREDERVDEQLWLDGNALPGLLNEVLATDVTGTERVCQSCGATERNRVPPPLPRGRRCAAVPRLRQGGALHRYPAGPPRRPVQRHVAARDSNGGVTKY
jgi:hypothetical protein